MGRECPVSGKKTTFGNQKTDRGKAKYLGGVGKDDRRKSARSSPIFNASTSGYRTEPRLYPRVATSVIRSGMMTRSRRQGHFRSSRSVK